MRTMIDRGGTFTDIVTVDDEGRVRFRKVRSDQARIGDLAEGALRFGTTVATNALLERTGVRTLALLTAGLEDLPWIRDMTRPDLFDPFAVRAPPLCHASSPVQERCTATGEVLLPLQLPDPTVLDGYEAVAIVLLHGALNPQHELQLGAWVAAHRPNVFVALGHQISPECGYLERIETTLVHAAITPILQRRLQADHLPTNALAIRSDGSLCSPQQLIAPDAVLSGPAGGVLAVRAIAQAAGFDKAIGLDVGGTSADICRVGRDLPRRTGAVEVAGVRVRRPMLAVDTIAAGGGSILWSDGTRIGVGPQSAGADPGPQCYGRGGPPTLTDAALVAGRIDPRGFSPPLAVGRVKLPGPAVDYLNLAEELLAGAVRKRVLTEGEDPAEHVLIAFGGAAGQYAVGVAERLGIHTVLIHPAASVLSAWGQALAAVEQTSTAEVPPGTHPEVVIERLGTGNAWVRARVVGTEGWIEVPWKGWRKAFEHAYERRFGRLPLGDVAIDSVRVTQTEPSGSLPTPIVRFEPKFLEGGVRWDSDTTSVWVPHHWSGEIKDGLLHVTPRSTQEPDNDIERTPAGVALWSARFMHAAEQGGTVLQRLARSINIRERLDFSCAVFTGAGVLVANAPHIPVHLGAMGVTVRDLLREPRQVGSSWVCNDPAAGGSHLPDLTVITIGEIGGQRVIAASRGHHVDVGGKTPGSMPPRSHSLAEEGVIFRHIRVASVDLSGTRQPDVVRADLHAQVAANQAILTTLRRWGTEIHPWMDHVLDASAELAGRFQMPTGTAYDTIDGVPLQVTLSPNAVDFSGTGGPHPGNLNAPLAVTRSAVLYALRVMLRTELPLNEGLLRNLEIRVPSGSILDPPPGSAVAGGNVETSMRVAELILKAAKVCAFSAGSMSNLSLGSATWAHYETLGGGQGASSTHDGPSARQVHLTNTRATDPEVLERRTPIRVWSFSIRRGSGAVGQRSGGDGLLRELEALEPCSASLLATRRGPAHDTIVQGGTERPWSGETVLLAAGDRVCVRTPGGEACNIDATVIK